MNTLVCHIKFICQQTNSVNVDILLGAEVDRTNLFLLLLVKFASQLKLTTAYESTGKHGTSMEHAYYSLRQLTKAQESMEKAWFKLATAYGRLRKHTQAINRLAVPELV